MNDLTASVVWVATSKRRDGYVRQVVDARDEVLASIVAIKSGVPFQIAVDPRLGSLFSTGEAKRGRHQLLLP